MYLLGWRRNDRHPCTVHLATHQQAIIQRLKTVGPERIIRVILTRRGQVQQQPPTYSHTHTHAGKKKEKRYELDLVPPGVLLEPEETESRCTVPILYKVRKYSFAAIRHPSWNISYMRLLCFRRYSRAARGNIAAIAREFVIINYHLACIFLRSRTRIGKRWTSGKADQKFAQRKLNERLAGFGYVDDSLRSTCFLLFRIFISQAVFILENVAVVFQKFVCTVYRENI